MNFPNSIASFMAYCIRAHPQGMYAKRGGVSDLGNLAYECVWGRRELSKNKFLIMASTFAYL